MSLSKLGTSGTSSQIAFNGQNPFSEKQHPLLLPVVLDNLFSYLTFSELKSSRLVCKAWSEVGIPFIGRRELKPVKFSDIGHEDFLALRKEFEDPSKPHPKLKLFQGFRLTWVEVFTMAYCNFMPSFKPSELVISGEDVKDPTVSLRTLLQPTVATLRDLSISLEIESDKNASCDLSDLLQDLVELGMTLKLLKLDITDSSESEGQGASNDWSVICRKLNILLQNQAPFLEDLCLMIFRDEDEDSMIQFPALPRLQLLMITEILPNFQAFDACVIFPNLDCLIISYTTLSEMTQEGGTFDKTKGHPLKKADIFGCRSEFTKFPNESLNRDQLPFSRGFLC